VPDVVTMNNAHGTHWTPNPDPGIDHVLRGWNPTGDGPAEHRAKVGDATIRNVPTDIRGYGGTRKDGNSIFVFEVADLCIGHLGHLHHVPTEEQFAALGRMDVLMVPVDGVYTMNVADMVGVVKRLKSSIVLPMHYFGAGSLDRFLAGMADEFTVRENPGHVLTVSFDALPSSPEVVVMRPTRSLPRERIEGLD
jgi:L-ascorbate metabolism protein UlaG (beta-lactamase superfamily)